MLSNMHNRPRYDTGRRTRSDNLPIVKPKCVADYNTVMRGVDYDIITYHSIGLQYYHGYY